ncbi:MAG: alpha/beta fold hydrolase [Planctomycetota bacterium]
MRARLRRSLWPVPLLLSACATPPEIPPWFDAIARQPVHTTSVNGTRIAYLDAGDGPPVLLVHGFGGSMWHWEYQQAALAPHFRVITLDLPGSGLSDKPDIAYTPEELVAFVCGFLDALGIHRAALVGNSMGAGLAIGMAVAHPERVDRLVLIGGLPQGVRDKLTGPLLRRAVETSAPTWLIEFGNWLAGSWVTEDALGEIVHDHQRLTPAVIERSVRNRQRPGLIRAAMAMAGSLPRWEQGFARRIAEVSQPTLVVWGEHDQVFPPAVGRELQAAIAGATFVLIPDAGHLPQWERPESVNPLLTRFLKP